MRTCWARKVLAREVCARLRRWAGGHYGGLVLFLQSCARFQALKGVTQGMTAILDPTHIPGVWVAAGRPVRVGLPALRLRGDTQWLSPMQGRGRSRDPQALQGGPRRCSGSPPRGDGRQREPWAAIGLSAEPWGLVQNGENLT